MDNPRKGRENVFGVFFFYFYYLLSRAKSKENKEGKYAAVCVCGKGPEIDKKKFSSVVRVREERI